MKSSILVRQSIQQTLKDFPWSYPEQETTILELIDGILAFRTPSWSSIARWSLNDCTVKKFWYLAHNGHKYLKACFQAINRKFNTIDHRNTFYISIDDTTQQRYGSGVYGASVFRDHTHNGYLFGNTLVNCYVHSKTYLESDYLPYLSKKYLEKIDDTSQEFKTKIQQAINHFILKIKSILAQGVSKDKIWLTIDSWYISEAIINLTKYWGINYLVGIKKNAIAEHFGQSSSLQKLFDRDDPWKQIANKNTGSIMYYKTKILYLPKYGRLRVFATKQGQDNRIHYYITNHTKMTIQTFSRHWKSHWQIERFHYYVKDYFGLEDCYSGSKKPNLFHWTLSHLIYKLFWSIKKKLEKRGLKYTFERLWELYCLNYDIERAKQLTYSKEKRKLLIRKVEAF